MELYILIIANLFSLANCGFTASGSTYYKGSGISRAAVISYQTLQDGTSHDLQFTPKLSDGKCALGGVAVLIPYDSLSIDLQSCTVTFSIYEKPASLNIQIFSTKHEVTFDLVDNGFSGSISSTQTVKDIKWRPIVMTNLMLFDHCDVNMTTHYDGTYEARKYWKDIITSQEAYVCGGETHSGLMGYQKQIDCIKNRSGFTILAMIKNRIVVDFDDGNLITPAMNDMCADGEQHMPLLDIDKYKTMIKRGSDHIYVDVDLMKDLVNVLVVHDKRVYNTGYRPADYLVMYPAEYHSGFCLNDGVRKKLNDICAARVPFDTAHHTTFTNKYMLKIAGDLKYFFNDPPVHYEISDEIKKRHAAMYPTPNVPYHDGQGPKSERSSSGGSNRLALQITGVSIGAACVIAIAFYFIHRVTRRSDKLHALINNETS